MREAVRTLDRLGETHTEITGLTGIPVAQAREYLAEPASAVPKVDLPARRQQNQTALRRVICPGLSSIAPVTLTRVSTDIRTQRLSHHLTPGLPHRSTVHS
jgi:hypothetical protein